MTTRTVNVHEAVDVKRPKPIFAAPAYLIVTVQCPAPPRSPGFGPAGLTRQIGSVSWLELHSARINAQAPAG